MHAANVGEWSMNGVYIYNAGKGECIRLHYGDGHNIFIDTGVTRFADTLKRLCREIMDAGEALDLLIEYYGSNVPLFRRNGYRQSGAMIP